MKQFLVLLFMVGTLKETMSLDVYDHEEVIKCLNEGFRVDHVSVPTVTAVMNLEDIDHQYNVAVTVTMKKGDSIEDVTTNYINEFVPILKGLLDPGTLAVPILSTEIEVEESEPVEPATETKLSDLLVPQLKDLAKAKGITDYKKMNKPELLQALTAKPKTTPTPKATPAPNEKKLTKAQAKRVKREAKRAESKKTKK